VNALELLLSRDSAVRLQEPGPSLGELDTIFKSALRAPDNGRLRPWRFVVIAQDKRERFGDVMAKSLRDHKPDATPEIVIRERQKALRAPMIVVSAARTIQNHKIPVVEQLLSAGAAAQNIMLAAHALGYGAMWKTGSLAYDDRVKRALGLESSDAIAGFIYIGTRVGGSSPAPRPVPADFVAMWQG